jgi:hypothetical protein
VVSAATAFNATLSRWCQRRQTKLVQRAEFVGIAVEDVDALYRT